MSLVSPGAINAKLVKHKEVCHMGKYSFDTHAVVRAVATVLLDFWAHPETAGPQA